MEDFTFESDGGLADRYLTFVVGGEAYGIPIEHVTEIVGLQEITQVPQAPDYVVGVINLRGRIIPVIDVKTRFKLPPETYTDRTCIVVVDLGSAAAGLIVDSVSEVSTIPRGDVSGPPQISSVQSNKYVEKIGKIGAKVVILLDCRRLLSHDELDILSAILKE